MTNWQQITSSNNSRFKSWKQLFDGRGIRKQSRFLLSGEKTLSETLERHREYILEIIISPNLRSSVRGLDIPVFELSASLFKEIDIIGTKSPYLVCKLPEIPKWQNPGRGLHLLCPLGDPTNVGNLVRTAAAMQVDAFVLLKECVTPFHLKSMRSASGTLFSMPFFSGPSIHDLDSVHGVALNTIGQSMVTYSWPQHVNLLIGEEGPGIPENLKWQRLTIPQSASVESLNATIAAGMTLFSYRQKWPLKLKG